MCVSLRVTGGSGRHMSADRQEDRVHEAARDMEREADEMERQSQELDEHIDEAKSAATKRQDAPEQARDAEGSEEPPEGTEDVAGDWRGESSGAQQGDDAEDAAGEQD